MKRFFIIAGGGLLGIFLTIALLESGAAAIRGRQGNAATTGFALETPDLTEVPDLGGEGFASEGMVSEGMASDGVSTGENADGGGQAGPENSVEAEAFEPQDKPVGNIAPVRLHETPVPGSAEAGISQPNL